MRCGRSVLQVLVALHSSVGLVFTPIEDATLGMWLAGMNVTRLNWPGSILSAGWTCCFTRTVDWCVALLTSGHPPSEVAASSARARVGHHHGPRRLATPRGRCLPRVVNW